MPQVSKWVEHGILKILKWNAVPQHEGLAYWDQRLAYNHAVLAHLGRPTFVVMLDLDEYVSVDCLQDCTLCVNPLIGRLLRGRRFMPTREPEPSWARHRASTVSHLST